MATNDPKLFAASEVSESRAIDDLTIVRPLGAGSATRVYLARDTIHDREVALRIVERKADDTVTSLQSRQAAFRADASVSATLDHDNILQVYGAGEHYEPESRVESVYLAMEYVPGGASLADYCAPDNLRPLAEVIRMIKDCAEAVDHAHRHDIIHNALKPKSVLVTVSGAVKVKDFAHARVVGVDAAETVEQHSISSPLYFSPEQLNGRDVGPTSDVFALGVMLYELLAGRHPFMAAVIPAIANNVTRKAHAPLRDQRPDIPPALEAIVDRALKKHPAGRYQTALDMAGDLALVLDDIELSDEDDVRRTRFELAREAAFFASFETEQMWELLNVCSWREYVPGETILEQEQLGDTFFVLLKGSVSVRKGAVEVDVLTSGEPFGEVGFVKQKRRTATIVARDQVIALEMRQAYLRRTSTGCQLQFHRSLVEVMVERLSRSYERQS